MSNTPQKKPFVDPKLVVYGDIKQLTEQAVGNNRAMDNGSNPTAKTTV